MLAVFENTVIMVQHWNTKIKKIDVVRDFCLKLWLQSLIFFFSLSNTDALYEFCDTNTKKKKRNNSKTPSVCKKRKDGSTSLFFFCVN